MRTSFVNRRSHNQMLQDNHPSMKRFILCMILSISSILLSFCGNKMGEITLLTDTYDFGSFPQKQVHGVVFIFRNTGTAPVVIQSASATCSCTSVTYSSKPVLPGHKGYITVWFNGTLTTLGHFSKTVDINSNASNGLVRVTITGEVLQDKARSKSTKR